MASKVLEYVSKNGRLKLITRGYNNKVFIVDTNKMLCEFTDTDVNAIRTVEQLSKDF